MIYLATYPAMMQCYESFDVGFFDLVIFDESHRSIYKKYRELVMYFDALQVGLTATPLKYADRDTFKLFGCEHNDPTSNFAYDEAVGGQVISSLSACGSSRRSSARRDSSTREMSERAARRARGAGGESGRRRVRAGAARQGGLQQGHEPR